MSKTRPCSLCKKRPRSSHVVGPDLCDVCHEYAGWENTHQDEGHDDMSSDNPTEASYLENCPVCLGTPAPWTITEEPKMKNTKATVVRNPQTHTSHASCGHPRTPKARAACRKARARVSEIAALPTVASVVAITRKQAASHRGDVVHVATRDSRVLTGQLVSWGPQVLTIVPDAATQELLGRTWKRETVHAADIASVSCDK